MRVPCQDTPSAWFVQRSSPGIASAVAVFEIIADRPGAIEAACQALGFQAPAVGRVGLRSVDGVDTLLALRPADGCLFLTPHGSVAVCRALRRALLEAGLAQRREPPEDDRTLLTAWPEARDPIQARALEALSRARGSRAVACLLDQPRRWAQGLPEVPGELARQLDRLLHAPLVVATGPANVGKSALTNALAKRTVSRVADRPGVTRDAVAVDLELDGLVVRWLDAPGTDLAQDQVLAQAQRLAETAIASADLVLWCQDASAPDPGRPADGPALLANRPAQAVLTVATRLDRAAGTVPRWADLAVSSRSGAGLAELARAVRQRLVGDQALEHPGRWAFW
ncbi:MAG: hypothetical protein KatS3mg103_0426 [Phycisphaerales bacterium]|nr:MAG: hypothetical protein KatS3mg103_0426 [Phycisphaerales bacterium]